MRMLLLAAAALAGVLLAAPVGPAAAQDRCGDGVRVQPGDTLARIAGYCGVSIGALLGANPEIRDPTRIYVGQVIRMPGQGPAYGPGPADPVRPAPPQPGRCGDGVRVQAGDTLGRIAAYCGVSVGALLEANPSLDPRGLRVGQVVRMPGYGRPGLPPPVADADCGEAVRVRPGDTLYRIAARCGTTVGRLVAANPQLRRPGGLIAGELVFMPGFGPGPGQGPVDPPVQQVVRITGTVTREGVECPTVRGDDGRLYSLTGRFERLRPGDRVSVTGRRAEISVCQQGVTIEVRRLTVEDDGRPDRYDITGVLTEEDRRCPTLRGDDGRLYALVGDIGRYDPGDRVRVRGRELGESECRRGIPVQVRRISRAR